MSLLLEALKRAERQRQQPEPPPPRPAEEETRPADPVAAPEPQSLAPFPELAMTLEPLPSLEPQPETWEPPQKEQTEVLPAPEAELPAEAANRPLELSLAEQLPAPSPPAAAPLEIAEPSSPAERAPLSMPEVAEPVRLDAAPLEMAPPAPPEHTRVEPKEPAPADAPPPAKTAGSPFANEDQRKRVNALLGASQTSTKPPTGRKRQLALGGIALAVALGTAGGLFWLEQQTPQPIAVPVDTPSESPAEASNEPSAPEGTDGNPESKGNNSPSIADARQKDAPLPAPKRNPQAEPSPSPVPPPGATPVAIRRNDSIIIVHPATEAGYAAMANGNLGAAREHYQQALKSDQRSRDAILGLAVTALREGRGDEAVRRYEQLLALDPRDPDANAGLALLRGAMDPVAYESRLKSLMEERGDNAALHHALGSLLARQHRWGEAQEAFFRAVTLAPRSADYLFNLAVALDHLGQYIQARNYYRQALDAPSPGSSTFSREAAKSRMAALEALAQ